MMWPHPPLLFHWVPTRSHCQVLMFYSIMSCWEHACSCSVALSFPVDYIYMSLLWDMVNKICCTGVITIPGWNIKCTVLSYNPGDILKILPPSSFIKKIVFYHICASILSLAILFLTTPLCQDHVWLCCKEFNKMMIWSASYRMELGLLSGSCCECFDYFLAFAILKSSKSKEPF